MLNPKYVTKINSLVNYANTSDNYGNSPKLCFYQKTITTASFIHQHKPRNQYNPHNRCSSIRSINNNSYCRKKAKIKTLLFLVLSNLGLRLLTSPVCTITKQLILGHNLVFSFAIEESRIRLKANLGRVHARRSLLGQFLKLRENAS